MLSIFIVNSALYRDGSIAGEWLVLPCANDKIATVLKSIGINESYDEWLIMDYSCELDCVCNVISENSNIKILNDLSKRISELNIFELKKLEAIAESMGKLEAGSLLKFTYNLNCFNLYPDITTPEKLGKYYFELSAIKLSEQLVYYFDFMAYGEDIDSETTGSFTSYGYLEQVENFD